MATKLTRRNYFIAKGIQSKNILLTSLVMVIHTFIVLVAVFTPYSMMLTMDYPGPDKAEAARAMLLLQSRAWPIIGVIICFFAVMTLFMNHRITGPILNIKRGEKSLQET